MIGWLTAGLQIIAQLLSFKKAADDSKTGQTEQRAADAEANLDLIRKANIAAKQAEQDDGARDPNDRARR